MIDFDIDAIEALVHCYSVTEDRIEPGTLEKIVAKACNGKWIPGDTYIIDAIWNGIGLNIKSRYIKFNKSKVTQRVDVIGNRLPVSYDRMLSDDELGNSILNDLIKKREQSINYFNLEKIYDVVIMHHKIDNDYKIKIFVSEHPHYENYSWKWNNGYGFIQGYEPWKFKRRFSDSGGYQNCLLIKNDYNLNDCIVDLVVPCAPYIDLTVEEAKKRYELWQNS